MLGSRVCAVARSCAAGESRAVFGDVSAAIEASIARISSAETVAVSVTVDVAAAVAVRAQSPSSAVKHSREKAERPMDASHVRADQIDPAYDSGKNGLRA